MPTDPLELIVAIFFIGLAVLMVCALGVGACLIVRDTIRQRGGWGIPLKTVQCAGCGEPPPLKRVPTSFGQAMWGDWHCEQCGFDLDKYGEPLAGQKLPAKLRARALRNDKFRPRPASDDKLRRGDDNVRS